MEAIVMAPIGVIRTPHKNLEGMPIQPSGAGKTIGQVVVAPRYAEGLDDIEGFSHVILIYAFHQSQGYQLKVKPFLDDEIRGLFATRAPRRPNPIGLSVVSLISRSLNVLNVEDIDVLDGTPLLDIKPYVPAFDAPEATAVGWLSGKADLSRGMRSDKRFAPKPHDKDDQ